MAAQDFYQVLGVPRDASAEVIRKAFKKIARENHPDAKKDDPAAAERFKAAAEAYDVLGDDEKRKKYDQFGANWKHFKEGKNPFGGGDPFRSGGPVEVDLRDVFGGGGPIDLGELFGGMFGGAGGGSRGSRAAPRARRGEDVSTSIQIPFDTAALGGNHDVTIQRDGRFERLGVKIPAGIDEGQTIRLAGQGQPGQGGPPGDMLVSVSIAPHPWFRREGLDLLVEIPVTITESALGARIDVPTLSEGLVSLTLPAGTASGAKLRLRGKGVKNSKTGAAGDQYAVVKVVPPKGLETRSRELLEEFAKLNPQDPRAGLW